MLLNERKKEKVIMYEKVKTYVSGLEREQETTEKIKTTIIRDQLQVQHTAKQERTKNMKTSTFILTAGAI